MRPGPSGGDGRARHCGRREYSGDRATLIDWGSSRIDPAALDLANLVTAGSAGVTRYARTWRQLTGEPVPAATIGLGHEWAALQIPMQYLAWVAGNRPAPEVGTALDQIEAATGRLSAENGIWAANPLVPGHHERHGRTVVHPELLHPGPVPGRRSPDRRA